MRPVFAFLITCLLTACSTTTIYLVRHAGKVDETNSTELSPAGRQRAIALADTLAKIAAGEFDNLLRVRVRQSPFDKSIDLSETTYGQMTPP